MKEIFTKTDLKAIKSIIIEAGDIGLKIQQENINIKRKKDRSIVTEADLLIQKYIIEKVSKKISGLNFICEENFDRSSRNVSEETISVIIDPIDGTAMYSMYLPIWCISIGIFSGYKPLHGFVYSPASSMFFYNDNDHSYLNDRIVIADKKKKIDNETNIFYSTEVYGKVGINFSGKVRNLGSTALHASLTTDNKRNRVLAFIGKSYLWDWAGAIPIILKAKGNIRYISGKEIDYKEVIENNYEFPDYLIAYNSDDFEFIKKLFPL